jgi:hypothetical protein
VSSDRALLDPPSYFGEWQAAKTGRGELDRQRQAVQAVADLRDERRVLVSHGEVVSRGRCPHDEQLPGLGLTQRFGAR